LRAQGRQRSGAFFPEREFHDGAILFALLRALRGRKAERSAAERSSATTPNREPTTRCTSFFFTADTAKDPMKESSSRFFAVKKQGEKFTANDAKNFSSNRQSRSLASSG
jgi:hypothetical protein